MTAILPNHLAGHGPSTTDRDSAFNQMALRVGEVVEVISPKNKKNRSKRMIEYRIRVQHKSGGTAGVVEYPNCVVNNLFGGFADRTRWRPRADAQSGDKGKPAKGSKVLLLFINGERVDPVIVGGLRDTTDTSEKELSDEQAAELLAELEYNGVHFQVNHDGELTVTRKGPTTADGKLDEKHEKVGTQGSKISLTKDGNITISDPGEKEAKQSILLDHKNRKMTIVADQGWDVTVTGGATIKAKGVTVTATGDKITIKAEASDVVVSAPKGKINLGDGANEPVPMGNVLMQLLTELITQLSAMTHSSAVGPTSPPLNAPALQAVAQKLSTMLSQQTFVKKVGG